MNQDGNLPLAYIVTRLIDLQTAHPEIAAKTGTTENYVSEMEARTKDTTARLARADGTLTATETLLLRWLIYDLAATASSTGKMEGTFGTEDTVLGMAEAFGAETTLEIAEVMESLTGKGFFESLLGPGFLDTFSEEHDDEPEDQEPENQEPEDDVRFIAGREFFESLLEPDPQEPETNLLDPRAWEGPPSRLLTELLEQEQDRSDDQERPTDTTLYYILRKDTLRILMETGEFMAILDRIMEEEPAGVKEDARWPHSGPIYIELTEASPEMPEEYRGFVHSFIITEDYGDDIRKVMIPNNLENGPGTIGAGLNIKTGEIVGIFGPETRWERTIELVRRLAAFLTDENNEFVEMPLSRSQRRRLQRSGQPNPWHLVRHRSREDAPRG